MSRICIYAVHILDGMGGDFPSADIFVEESDISEVRIPSGDLPQNCQIIDGLGRTVMPGLIDGHVHLTFDSSPQAPFYAVGKSKDEVVQHAYAQALQYLHAGVTTVRDLGGSVHAQFSIRDELKGCENIPRVYDCVATMSAAGGVGLDVAVPLTKEKAPSIIEDLAGRADTLKILGDRYDSGSPDGFRQQFDDDAFSLICRRARDADLPVTVHAKAKATIQQCIANDVHCIEHGINAGESELLAIAERGIFLEATFWGLKNRAEAVPGFDEFNRNMTWFPAAAERNVNLTLGSDSGTVFTPHAGAPHELEFLVEAGYSASRAIIAATSLGARLVRNRSIGVIAPGKRADLLLLSQNPLADIRSVRRDLAWVMKDGRIVHETGK